MTMKISQYDTYKVLSTVGGVPWYLEQFISSLTVDENIRRLAFEKNGLLVGEFDRIFHDLFHGKGTAQKKIVDCLKNSSKTLSEIRQSIEFAHSGTLSRMMDQMIVVGFVAKHSLWSFKTSKPLKQSLYRISDPYLRFYFKLIEPNLVTIMDNGFDQVPISTIPGFDSHMGFQLEVLLQQNWQLLIQKLGISPVDVVRHGPYRQPKNTSMEGCQIDYLVQTKTNTLYICEIKFKRHEIGIEIITEMQEKMSRLKTTKGFAKVAVLFHLVGITNSLATSSFFYRIVDISDFLEGN